MDEVKLVVDCANTLGEGPVWSVEQQKLYWADIEAKKLWQYDPVTGLTNRGDTPEKLCSLAFREEGWMLAAFSSGLSFFDPLTGKQQRIHDVEADLPSTRLNDGRCDRRGRFFVGGYDTSGRGLAALYRLDIDLSLHQLFGGLCSANSTCFSLDGQTMYFADTPRREIWAFNYDPDSGCLGDRRTFCRFDDQPGMPDGSIVDAEGFLWNAQWNGARVVRYDQAGNIDRIIEMPCLNPTCLAFGGKDLDTLFITSARYHMSQEQILYQPQAGGLFAIIPGVYGLPESNFYA
jgi:L-arabinonolactonase